MAGRSDGTYIVEVSNNNKVTSSDIINKDNKDNKDNNLYINTKESQLNYKNGDLLTIKEIDDSGVFWLESIKLE